MYVYAYVYMISVSVSLTCEYAVFRIFFFNSFLPLHGLRCLKLSSSATLKVRYFTYSNRIRLTVWIEEECILELTERKHVIHKFRCAFFSQMHK